MIELELNGLAFLYIVWQYVRFELLHHMKYIASWFKSHAYQTHPNIYQQCRCNLEHVHHMPIHICVCAGYHTDNANLSLKDGSRRVVSMLDTTVGGGGASETAHGCNLPAAYTRRHTFKSPHKANKIKYDENWITLRSKYKHSWCTSQFILRVVVAIKECVSRKVDSDSDCRWIFNHCLSIINPPSCRTYSNCSSRTKHSAYFTIHKFHNVILWMPACALLKQLNMPYMRFDWIQFLIHSCSTELLKLVRWRICKITITNGINMTS